MNLGLFFSGDVEEKNSKVYRETVLLFQLKQISLFAWGFVFQWKSRLTLGNFYFADYITAFCIQNNKDPPSEKDINQAFTQQVTYARTKLKSSCCDVSDNWMGQ